MDGGLFLSFSLVCVWMTLTWWCLQTAVQVQEGKTSRWRRNSRRRLKRKTITNNHLLRRRTRRSDRCLFPECFTSDLLLHVFGRIQPVLKRSVQMSHDSLNQCSKLHSVDMNVTVPSDSPHHGMWYRSNLSPEDWDVRRLCRTESDLYHASAERRTDSDMKHDHKHLKFANILKKKNRN